MDTALLSFLALVTALLLIDRWRRQKIERSKKYAIFVVETYAEPDGSLLQRQKTLAVYDDEKTACSMLDRQLERDRIEKPQTILARRYFVLEFGKDEGGLGLGVGDGKRWWRGRQG